MVHGSYNSSEGTVTVEHFAASGNLVLLLSDINLPKLCLMFFSSYSHLNSSKYSLIGVIIISLLLEFVILFLLVHVAFLPFFISFVMCMCV